jgi:tetratricopeptide (TPR) repeat protein
MSYGEKGMFTEAEAEFKKALAISEDDSETMSAMAYVYAAAGRTDEAPKIRDRLIDTAKESYVSPYSLARVHIGLGQLDEAFECLEKTYQQRHGILTYVKVEPIFDRLRSDSRFADLLIRMDWGVRTPQTISR